MSPDAGVKFKGKCNSKSNVPSPEFPAALNLEPTMYLECHLYLAASYIYKTCPTILFVPPKPELLFVFLQALVVVPEELLLESGKAILLLFKP